MFVGSINQDLRAMLAEMATAWKGRPVYVGCSGNMTVERIVAQAGVTEIHGCDVSLYSCVLGKHLAGEAVPVSLKEEAYAWMLPFMAPGVPLISTLLMAMEYFKFTDRLEPYHRRMAAYYETQWAKIHAATVERVSKGIDGVTLTSFCAGDVVPFVELAPPDAVVISFPPTYAKGYERLYKKIDAVFGWDAPEYVTFDEPRFAEFLGLMMSRQTWVTLRDADVGSMRDYLIGRTEASANSKPVYVYASEGPTRITAARQKVEQLSLRRREGIIAAGERLAVRRISGHQLNTLRSLYLAATIKPGAVKYAFAVTVGDELIGAIGFNTNGRIGNSDMLVTADFCIAPSVHKRLSKLVLAAVLSTEVRLFLEQAMSRRIEVLGTVVFTKKPVSMKYRGLFQLHSRKENALNYVAKAGKWSLADGLAWWLKTHAKD